MSQSKHPIRIYLQYDGYLRSFYWVDIGYDGSIYFGTSVREFRRSGFSSSDVYSDGSGTEIEMDFDQLVECEVGGKHSIHNSGSVLGFKIKNGRRTERQTLELDNYERCIPIVGVLPMVPLAYPRTQKSIRQTDMVLDTSPVHANPFAFLLYIQPNGVRDAPDLDRYRIKGKCVESESELCGITIRCALYTDPARFKRWPSKQVEAIARGVGDSPPLQFPMFTTAQV